MLHYLIKRVGSSLFVLFLLSLMVFAMVRAIPGDPVAALVDQNNPDPAVIASLRHELGLDRPFWIQYFSWIGGVLQGDFGQSLTKPYTVMQLVAGRMPVSIELAIMATVIGLVIGIPVGLWAARRINGVFDTSSRFLSFAFLAIPPFALGTVLLLLNSLTVRAQLFGYVPFAQDPVRNLSVFLLPALLLGVVMAAVIMRYLRGTLLDTFSQDFVKTARAKGALPGRIITRHAFRNALIPVTTVVGIELGTLVGGTVVVETVFS
ncbi:MAG: ABC transporter permease, partial [Brachybacterium sp.]|nr:ABC transporter permease [Brachybacterium sp.]